MSSAGRIATEPQVAALAASKFVYVTRLTSDPSSERRLRNAAGHSLALSCLARMRGIGMARNSGVNAIKAANASKAAEIGRVAKTVNSPCE